MNPEANIGDWLKYSSKLSYQNTSIQLEELKHEITLEEYHAALKELEQFKIEHNIEL